MRSKPLPAQVLFLVAVSVDPERIGFGTAGAGDTLRWAWISAVLFLPLFAVVARPQPGAIGRSPARFLLAAAGVGALVAPLSDVSVADTVLAAGFVSLGMLGVLWSAEHGFARLLDSYGIATFIVCVAGFWPTLSLEGTRLIGLYSAANIAGIHGAILVVDGTRRWLRSPRGGRHAISGALLPGVWIVLGMAVLVLSDSRTSMAAALFGVLFLARAAVPRAIVAASVVIGLAAVATTLSTDLAADVGREVSRTGELEEITTVTGRVGVWEQSLGLIADRPALGYGVNGANAEFVELAEEGRLGFEPAHAHNLLLQMALNGGVLAAVLLVVGVAAFAANGRLRADPARSAMVVVLLVHGLTEAIVRVPNDLWLVLVAALAVAVSEGIADQGARSASSRQTSPLKI